MVRERGRERGGGRGREGERGRERERHNYYTFSIATHTINH